MQHHVPTVDRNVRAASVQRLIARGFGKIMKTGKRAGGVAGACKGAVGRKGSDRTLDALDQKPQALGQRQAATGRLGCRDQDGVMAVGKIQPHAGAGHELAELRPEAAQPLQPHRADGGEPRRELRNLPPVRVGRTERSPCEFSGIRCAEQLCSDRIGPQDLRAVGRPQPCRRRARRMLREPQIAGEMRLEIGDAHAVLNRNFCYHRCAAVRTFAAEQRQWVSIARRPWQVHRRGRNAAA